MSFYTPSTVGSLDRAASLAFDFQEMDANLVGTTRDGAKAIYERGAYCLSYAELSLDVALESDIPVGAVVKGLAASSSNGANDAIVEVEGRIFQRAAVGATTLQVRYLFTETPSGPNLCSVGGNPTPMLVQCFQSNGQIQVSLDSVPVNLTYSSYHPKTHTKNALTLQQLSHDLLTVPTSNDDNELSELHPVSQSHFQKVLQSYVNYYGVPDYANKWIQAAFQQISTNMDNGNASFSLFSDPADVNGTVLYTLLRDVLIATTAHSSLPLFNTSSAAISLGSLTMNLWMHVIRTMDEAIQKCRNGNNSSTQLPSSLSDWDDAMAFYAGTMGASDGSLSQLYGVADTYCQWFGTCDNQTTKGRAIVNQEILRLWNQGTQHLVNNECDSVDQVVRHIMAQMTIPLVQGLLYHAYELDVRQQQNTRPSVKVEAATFAAALLPLIHKCNAGNADSIYHNTKITVEGAVTSFHVIKGALERQYDCLGITCQQVGGIVDISNPSEFVAYAAPCGTEPKSVDDIGVSNGEASGVPTTQNYSTGENKGLKVGMSISAVLMGVLVGLILFYLRRGGRFIARPHGNEKEFDSASTASATTTVDHPSPQGETDEEKEIALEAEML